MVEFITISLVFLFFYAFLLFVISYFILKSKPASGQVVNEVFVSVIIAVRNEEKNISTLIESLKKQKSGFFDVTICDDHSTDKTIEIAQALISGDSRFKLVKSTGNGKKKALLKAASHSRGNYFLFTDGDCIPSAGWVESFRTVFRLGFTGACGVVKFHGRGSALLNLEFSALLAVTRGCISGGNPILANGASFGIKASEFTRITSEADYLNHPGGDDIFIIQRLNPATITFISHKNAFVFTESPEGLRDFIRQRTRWASKFGKMKSNLVSLIMVFVAIITWLPLISILLAVLKPEMAYFCASIVTAKFLIDFLFLFLASRLTESLKSLFWFPVAEMLYPFYLLIIGFLSFSKSMIWKGRVWKI